MSLETDLFAALRGLVGNRVYPLTIPQANGTPVWPAIRYTPISNIPVLDICGDDDEVTDEARIQIDIISTTYAEMKFIQRSVRDIMATFDPPATLESISEEFDSETKTRRTVMDYLFHGSSDDGNSP